MANKTQFSYDARKHFGTLSERKYRTLELNAIAYNEAEEAKYDLRRWLNVEGGTGLGKQLGKMYSRRGLKTRSSTPTQPEPSTQITSSARKS